MKWILFKLTVSKLKTNHIHLISAMATQFTWRKKQGGKGGKRWKVRKEGNVEKKRKSKEMFCQDAATCQANRDFFVVVVVFCCCPDPLILSSPL